MKKKAIVSACILGEYCRYDGKTKKISQVLEQLQEYEIIPFCPEAPLFGTPRERIDVVCVDNEERILTHNTQRDVTQELQKEIQSFMQKHPKADIVVLKAKSPSCGNGTTPVLDKNREVLYYGDGIGAKMMKVFYKETLFFDEKSFEKK